MGLIKQSKCTSCHGFNIKINATQLTDTIVTIPIGGNTWRTTDDTLGGNVTNEGIVNWTDKKAEFQTYVRFAHKCSCPNFG